MIVFIPAWIPLASLFVRVLWRVSGALLEAAALIALTACLIVGHGYRLGRRTIDPAWETRREIRGLPETER